MCRYGPECVDGRCLEKVYKCWNLSLKIGLPSFGGVGRRTHRSYVGRGGSLHRLVDLLSLTDTGGVAYAASAVGFSTCQSWQSGSYLVDPASSHMLVSKIKPCMSQYKLLLQRNREWLIKSVIVYLIVPFTWITVVILGLIHAPKPLAHPGGAIIRSRPNPGQLGPLW